MYALCTNFAYLHYDDVTPTHRTRCCSWSARIFLKYGGSWPNFRFGTWSCETPCPLPSTCWSTNNFDCANWNRFNLKHGRGLRSACRCLKSSSVCRRFFKLALWWFRTTLRATSSWGRNARCIWYEHKFKIWIIYFVFSTHHQRIELIYDFDCTNQERKINIERMVSCQSIWLVHLIRAGDEHFVMQLPTWSLTFVILTIPENFKISTHMLFEILSQTNYNII